VTTTEAVARWRCGSRDNPRGALIVLLHANGGDEAAMFSLAARLPSDATVCALRAPIPAGSGYAWFAGWSAGHPIPASLAGAIDYVQHWLDDEAGDAEEIWLAGCSEGATMAAALLLHDPQRYAGAAFLHGTLPLNAQPAIDGRLSGLEIFFGYRVEGAACELVARSRAYLRDASGADVEEHVYHTGSRSGYPEVDDIATWFAARFTHTHRFQEETP
jgi:phospholipase/carboxylesterase